MSVSHWQVDLLEAWKEHHAKYIQINWVVIKSVELSNRFSKIFIFDVECLGLHFEGRPQTNFWRTRSIMKVFINDHIQISIRRIVSENNVGSFLQRRTSAAVVFASFTGAIEAYNYYGKTGWVVSLHCVLLQLQKDSCDWMFECIMLFDPLAVMSIIARSLAFMHAFGWS